MTLGRIGGRGSTVDLYYYLLWTDTKADFMKAINDNKFIYDTLVNSRKGIREQLKEIYGGLR